MDGQRFDQITRALGAATSRRQAVKTIAAGIAGGALSLLGARQASATHNGSEHCRQIGAQCRSNAECCHRFCDSFTGTCLCPAGVTCNANDNCREPFDQCRANAECCLGVCDNATFQCLCVDLAPGCTESGQCRGDGDNCRTSAECCSGFCDSTFHCATCPANAPLLCRGSCIPACTAQDQCHVAGVCDPLTGQCTNPPAPNNTPCETGNLCTADTCQGGVCRQGEVDVPCAQCFRCAPTTGQCEVDPDRVDRDCDDDDPCTVQDKCNALGACVGRPKCDATKCEACVPDDAGGATCEATLHATLCTTANGTAGVCCAGVCCDIAPPAGGGDPAQFCGVAEGDPDGAFTCCDFDVACGNTCLEETCEATDQCLKCDPASSMCVPDEGGSCDDLNPCTVNEACDAAGVCGGGEPLCDATQCRACVLDPLDPDTATCPAILHGTPCTTANDAPGLCCDGVCCDAADETCFPATTEVGAFCCPNALVCGNTCLSAACNEALCLACSVDPVTRVGTCQSTCNPATHACVAGQCCLIGQSVCGGQCVACPSGGICVDTTCVCPEGQRNCGGTCVTGNCCGAADCPTPSNQCQQATCSGGVCGVGNKPNDTGCNDGNPCTTGESCQNGACTGGTLTPGCVTCANVSTCPTPSNQCQQATCSGGVCGVGNKPNDTGCNDGNACTTGESCQNGVCTGGTAVTCTLPQVCCPSGPHTGGCKLPAGESCQSNGHCCSNRCCGDVCCAAGQSCTRGVCT